MKKILLFVSIFICQIAGAQEVLTLEECLQMGESNNPYIRNAQLDILSSRAMKSEVAWEYFPTVSLNGIGYYAQDPLLNVGLTEILGNSDLSWNLNNAYVDFAKVNGLKTGFTSMQKGYGVAMVLTQPVYAGGRIVNGNRLAAIGIEASILQADMKIRDIREEVELKYWLIVALQEKMETLDKAESVLGTLFEQVISAREAGLVTDTDVMNVRQKITELSSGRIKLRNGLKLAKMDLFNAIGFKYEYLKLDGYLLDGDLDYIGSFESLDTGADSMPTEFKLLEMQEEAKKLEKKVAVGELLPEIGVGLSYGYGDIRGLNEGKFNGVGFVSVKIPITGIGKAVSRARRMDYQIRKAGNEKDYLDEQLKLQRLSMFLEIEAAESQAELSRSFRDDAEWEMSRCEGNYKAGRATLADLLQAELQYRNASEKYIDDCIEYRKAVNAYKRRYLAR